MKFDDGFGKFDRSKCHETLPAGLKIACTGFVSEEAGSVASANALLLGALLNAGVEIDFFSKPSFVDPRPIVGLHHGFHFQSVVNRKSDEFRRLVKIVPVLAAIAGRTDAACYNRLLVREMRNRCQTKKYRLVLWMGDYAHGPVPGVPAVSFAQGPPGTDARSVLERRQEIRRLAGRGQAWKWATLARVRLSRMGVPALRHSDHVIVGSRQSCRTLNQMYGMDLSRLSALPYPIDLDLFKAECGKMEMESGKGSLRVLWLGRIVPRKRLDLFLDGAALAIRQGIDVRLSIVGGVGFVRGYEQLLAAFPFPDRLEWTKGIARNQVPDFLRRHDVLAQPSDEENFGSSVAEAQACGLPVIVGWTNGNADYLCSRDIHLCDDRKETLASALREMTVRRMEGRFGEAAESRKLAEEKFSLEKVTALLMEVLQSVVNRSRTSAAPA